MEPSMPTMPATLPALYSARIAHDFLGSRARFVARVWWRPFNAVVCSRRWHLSNDTWVVRDFQRSEVVGDVDDGATGRRLL